jgi:hypothetical protein
LTHGPDFSIMVHSDSEERLYRPIQISASIKGDRNTSQPSVFLYTTSIRSGLKTSDQVQGQGADRSIRRSIHGGM